MARVAIAGAGAAGLFAAGVLCAAGAQVVLIEHMDAPGKKLAITGKGRCNLTCSCDEAEFLQGVRRNPRFLYSAVHALPPAAVMALFEEELGVPLKTERGRRVFPQSDRAEDIVAALARRAAPAEKLRGRAVEVLVQDGRAAGFLLEDGRRAEADAVLIATGGLSYPVTGSTGLGYKMAEGVGHSIVPPVPSLVALRAGPMLLGRAAQSAASPMQTEGGPEGARPRDRGCTAPEQRVDCSAECRAMAGLSLRNVGLRLLQDGKPVFAEQGELLFTHFGLSGPLVLSASAYVEDLARHRYVVSIDLKPALNAEKLDARLQRDFAEAANRTAAHALDKLLPQSLRPVMLARWGLPPEMRVNQITKAQRQALGVLVKDFPIGIAGRGDLDHAVITAGGVEVREVDPKTMGSKRLPGLYFAGEVLDVDGYTGGYNLQIAWCTAFAAARGMLGYLDGSWG